MKILVLSDTHYILDNPLEILKRIHQKIEGVIHLGDNREDANALQSLYPSIPFYAVAGNCDFSQTDADVEQTIMLGGKTIYITHGHRYGVKQSYDRICYRAEEKNADICLFGHTHVPEIIRFGNTIVMNPGSASLPRISNQPTYGMLDIENDVVTPSIVAIDGNRQCRVIRH